MDRRQISVQDNDVVTGHRKAVESIGTVQGDVDGHAFSFESDTDCSGQHAVVFGDENPHGSMIADFR
jgi:hypothetical protein